MWRIGAWSAVFSHRNDQVTEMDTSRVAERLEKAIKFRTALHSPFVVVAGCYCSWLSAWCIVLCLVYYLFASSQRGEEKAFSPCEKLLNSLEMKSDYIKRVA